MTACATSPIPHPDPVPSAAGAAGGSGCCTGAGGPPHGRAPAAALPPQASGSRAGRRRQRGPAPQPSPSRPPTRSRPRRRGLVAGLLPSASMAVAWDLVVGAGSAVDGSAPAAMRSSFSLAAGSVTVVARVSASALTPASASVALTCKRVPSGLARLTSSFGSDLARGGRPLGDRTLHKSRFATFGG
jgi:hypothetical protein